MFFIYQHFLETGKHGLNPQQIMFLSLNWGTFPSATMFSSLARLFLIHYIFLFTSFKKHQARCSFKVVNCPNSGCKEKLTMQELSIHVTFECSRRKINCQYCKKSFVQNQKKVLIQMFVAYSKKTSLLEH